MLFTVFFTLSLAFQNQAIVRSNDPLQMMDKLEQSQERQQALGRASDKQLDMFLERKFEIKFNGVVKALEDFGSSWNRQHTIDPARAQRLKKAWNELVKAEPWFDASADK